MELPAVALLSLSPLASVNVRICCMPQGWRFESSSRSPKLNLQKTGPGVGPVF